MHGRPHLRPLLGDRQLTMLGGHKRGQSESNLPLRSVVDVNTESNELQVISCKSVTRTGSPKNNGVIINIDPIDPEPTPVHTAKEDDMILEANSEATLGLERWRRPFHFQLCGWLHCNIFLHHQRLVVLRRTFLLGAILYGLRAVVLGVTYLPPSFENRDEICQPQVNRTAMYGMEITTRFLTYVITLGLTSGQEKILCGDLMFSGHTVVLTIMYFVQLQYTPKGLVWLRYLAAPITFFGIAALVVSGGHYTMDVLIAYWLTSHVFWGYHQMFEMPKDIRPEAPMSRLWWFWLCYWFESDVREGRLTNEWNWPFKGPQRIHEIMDAVNQKLQ
ncbi:unnamed protein product [Caenorhabditis auriculariae]|uniref:Sphingomyelin synthase-like domain-containing protein n=1 Tax=Caenorhabditis auriculariae TaxID=2777116 RepID=A0A8S1GUU3_9PELO|nr:unnamed protein product [Caenorhabditis auriculariae]